MLPPKLLLFLLFILPTFLAAQDVLKSGALVYYYDGSIFQGEIVDDNEVQLSLRLSTEDTITVEKAFMERFYRIPQDIELFKKRRFHYNSGFFDALSFSFALDAFDGNSVQLDYLFGKRLTPRTAVALGTGLHFNDAFVGGLWITTNFVPIYAYGRYYLTQKRRRIYTAGKVGYSIPLPNGFNEHRGGIMVAPEIGIHFAGRKNTRFLIGIAQYLQTTKGENVDFDQFGNTIETRFNAILNRTALRLAWEFK